MTAKHTTETECGCKLGLHAAVQPDQQVHDGYFIELCQLHKSAPELLAALKETKDVLFLLQDGHVEERETMMRNTIAVAKAAIKLAEQGDK